MSKRWRRVFAVFAVLVIGLVAAVAVFLYTADYNRYKGLIADAITDATGRQVTIEGDLTLAMSLPPELTVSDVTLANAPWGSQPQMAHVGQLRMSLRILSLLKREVDISGIRLIGTDVLIEIGADGQSNWQLSHKPKSRRGVGIRDVAVRQLEVERLAVTLRGGDTGSAAVYRLDSLTLTRSAAADSLTFALTGSSNGQSASLSGQTGPLKDLFAGVRFPVSASGEFAGATVKLDGEIATALKLEGLDLRVRASGTDLATLGTGIAVKFPETDSFDMTAHLTGGGCDLTVRKMSGSASQQDIKLTISGEIGDLNRLDDIQLEVKGSGSDLAELGSIIDKTLPATGAFEVSGKLTGSAKALAVSGADGTISRKSAKISLTGKVADLIALKGINLDVEGSGENLGELRDMLGEKLPDTGPFAVAGRLTGSAKVPAVHDLRATVKHGDSQLKISGQIGDLLQTSDVSLSLEASGKNFGELGALFETQLPDLGAFNIKGQLSGSNKLLDLKSFSATVDQSDFNGWAKAEFGKRPKITARLESALIDFTRIMQQAKDEKEGEKDGEKGGVTKGGTTGKGASRGRTEVFSQKNLGSTPVIALGHLC